MSNTLSKQLPIEEVILAALQQIIARRRKIAEGSSDESADSSSDAGTPSPDKEQAARLSLVLKFQQSRWLELLSKVLNNYNTEALKELIKYLKLNPSDGVLQSVAKILSENKSKPIAIEALNKLVDTVDAHFRNIVSKTVDSSVKTLMNKKPPTPFLTKPAPIKTE